jgi:PKD repeat protein
VTDNNDHNASATSPATVSDAALTLTHFLAGATKDRYAALGATFTDADPNGQVSDYTASINWGDGNTTTVRVYKNPFGQSFVLGGLHQYARKGTYSVTLTIADAGGSQVTKTVSVTIR